MSLHVRWRSLTLIPLLLGLATAAFNLNTSGPDWDYTAKDLANTTSQTCKDAYSMDINCDATLLGLVASMRPAFYPSPSDFDDMCTPACKESLDAYVSGVQAACTAPGDKAQESVGGGDNVDMYLDPVEIVGQIFQYTLASDCATSSNGSYCYFEQSADADTFSCDDTCAVEFYKTAHEYPAATKEFNYYWLISRGSWWANEFATGWTRLTEVCGLAEDNSASSNSTESSAAGIGAGTSTTILSTAISTASSSSAARTQLVTATSSISSLGPTSSMSSPQPSTGAGEALKPKSIARRAFWSLISAAFLLR